MPGYQQTTIIGHVGKEPESKSTSAGEVFTQFPVAVGSKSKGQEKTDWYDVLIFSDATQQVAQKYVHKGDAIHVVGRATASAYISKNTNEPVVRTTLFANNITLLGQKPKATSTAEAAVPTSSAAFNDGEDLPF